MRFDPGSMLLWIDAERDELMQQFEFIQEFERRTGSSVIFQEQPAKLVIEGKLGEAPEANRAFIARLAHESAHLCHHMCTPFGYVYHVIASAVARNFAFAMGARRDAKREVSFPLFETSEFGDSSEPSDEQLCAMEYRALLGLQRAWDGDTADMNDYPPFIGLGLLDNWLRSSSPGAPQFGSWDPLMSPRPLNPSLVGYLSDSNPYVPQLLGIPFGARHLLETLAFTKEVSLGMGSGLDGERWVDMWGLGEYSLVKKYWLALFGNGAAFSSAETPGESVRVNNAGMGRPILPLEFIVAIDLALGLPIGPAGIVEADRPLTWTDVHPGWRFIQVCDYLSRTAQGWRRIPSGLVETDGVFLEIEGQVCKALGWPPPHSIVFKWIKFFERGMKEGGRGLFVELHQHPRYVGSLALAARRMAQPYSILGGYWDFSRVKVPWFPMVFARGRDLESRINEHVWEGEGLRVADKLWSYFVLHGSRWCAEGDAKMWHIPDRHVPPMITALSAFASQVDGGRPLFRDAAGRYAATLGIPIPAS